MSKTAKRLGRGLNSLVPNLQGEAAPQEEPPKNPKPSTAAPAAAGTVAAPAVESMLVDLGSIDANPYQPRTDMEDAELASLAESIKHSGILQPVTLRKKGKRFQIIAGERRCMAARLAGLSEIPSIIKHATDEQMIEWALIENIQREDLNAIDRAQAYRQLSDYSGLKPEQVGKRVGEDRSTVANYLRLLELPSAIQKLVAAGSLGMGHARCLLGVTNTTEQWKLAESAARQELSVRALEEIVRRQKAKQSGDGASLATPEPKHSAHTLDLQRQFEQALKTKVTIQESKRKGAGRITIQYFTLDDFDRIAEALGVHLE